MNLHAPGEPHQLTSLEFGAANPHWRPDSNALIVSSAIPVSKLPGKPEFSEARPELDWRTPPLTPDEKRSIGSPDGDLQNIRSWLDHNSEHADPADLTRIAFLGELALANDLAFSELFRVDLAANIQTSQLTKTFRNHSAATWTPKGDRILFSSELDATTHPDRNEGRSAIFDMTASGENEHLLIHPEGYSTGQPQFTRDGRIVFLAQQDDQPTYRQSMLALTNADGGAIKWLTKAGEPGILEFQIAPDDSVFYLSRAWR